MIERNKVKGVSIFSNISSDDLLTCWREKTSRKKKKTNKKSAPIRTKGVSGIHVSSGGVSPFPFGGEQHLGSTGAAAAAAQASPILCEPLASLCLSHWSTHHPRARRSHLFILPLIPLLNYHHIYHECHC